MARLFDDASSQSASIASAPVTAVPLTMACWYNVDTFAAEQALMGLYNNGVNDASYQLLGLTASSGRVRAATANSAGTANSSTGDLGTLNTWDHAAGVWASDAARTAYHNGSSGGLENTSRAPTGLNSTALGARVDTTPDRFLSGMLADAAIWNVALTAAEVLMLANGVSPLAVRPGNLVAYWPLWGVHSTEIDLKGGYPLTLTNGPTKAAHPRMRYLASSPYPGLLGTFVPGSGGGARHGWMWAG
jgi:hypothetical protein